MTQIQYAYSTKPTRNPFRYLLAVWRVMRDTSATEEAAIVEMGFARSKLGRRFARWDDVLETLRQNPQMAAALRARKAVDPIDLDRLEHMPEGSLGRVFERHCRARGLNPNLGYIAPENEVDWLLHQLSQTHDIWHVVTGWGNDELGEIGLGAFYLGQLRAPAFFGFLLGLLSLSTVLRRRSFEDFIESVTAGYNQGKQAQPLLGADWSALWGMPLTDVRRRFGLEQTSVAGEGILAAA